jgi:DGQHR domain-containing protein
MEVRQGPRRVLYSFAVDGKQLPRFAAISRVRRPEGARVEGYQRPEVVSHVNAIRTYLESDDPMIPNGLVVAFDDRVQFEPASMPRDGASVWGHIVIPIDAGLDDADKPGWIVDGQQRAAAIRDASIESFPIFVTAFITNSQSEQRSQFILVNSTKPLPKGLIHELLPTTDGPLPLALLRRRFPAYLLERLNYDADSLLRHKVRTPTHPDGVIKDNSLLRMIENSLSDGVLYRYRDPHTGEGDAEAMLSVLKQFWEAVYLVFAEAWDLPPRRSRLMHGVGIASLGFLMDEIAEQHEGEALLEAFVDGLSSISDVCAWTSGEWVLGEGKRRRWNELQNTPKDVQLLASFLLERYRRQRSAVAA